MSTTQQRTASTAAHVPCLSFPAERAAAIRAAWNSTHDIDDFTHGFYRYPARFPALLARHLILALTERGELVLDPFVGGGTTLVEALASHRPCAGNDINELSAFVSRVKTRIYTDAELVELEQFAATLPERLNTRRELRDASHSPHAHRHFRNLTAHRYWGATKIARLAVEAATELPTQRIEDLARCAILRTAQGLLDCTTVAPTANTFRATLLQTLMQFANSARRFRTSVTGDTASAIPLAPHLIAQVYAGDSRSAPWSGGLRRSPRLVLTSPPYPGVHVLYHRWQLRGRRELSLPYFLANCEDGRGESHYTFGSRKTRLHESYFAHAAEAYEAIAASMESASLLVQVLAFADPDTQLSRLLATLSNAGFEECVAPQLSDSDDLRPWRRIPNRRFYADLAGALHSSREVLLFHRLKT